MDRFQSLRFLDESDDRVQQDHADDDRGVDDLVQQARGQRRRKEEVDKRLVELKQELNERTSPAPLG